jgi:hypothetical protein
MVYNKFPAVDGSNNFPAPVRIAMAAYSELIAAFASKSVETSKADLTALNAHIGNVSNPHVVTKAQVGLGSVDNTTDLTKPASQPQKDLFGGQGSTTLRDTQYGIPSGAAAIAALANKKPVWYNTTTNMFESYYATTGTVGLTVTGITGASGWYPEISTVAKKVVLATPANHTLVSEFSVTRQGSLVTMIGRLTRNSGGTAFLPVGAIPVGFRPYTSLFPAWFIANGVVLGQIDANGGGSTPFSSATGDFMIACSWSTDPTVLPY